MSSFELFLEFKKQQKFNTIFEELCQKIALSNIPFQQYWENYALPILLESNFNDENELLNEISLRSLMGYPERPKTQQQPVQQPVQQQTRKPYDDDEPLWDDDDDDLGQYSGISPAEYERQQRSNQYAQQIGNQIKQSFLTYIKNFKQSMHNKAVSANNPHLWKATELFSDRIQNVTNQFVLNSSPTKKPTYKDDFKNFQKQHGQQQNAIGQQNQKAKVLGTLKNAQAQGQQAMAQRKKDYGL